MKGSNIISSIIDLKKADEHKKYCMNYFAIPGLTNTTISKGEYVANKRAQKVIEIVSEYYGVNCKDFRHECKSLNHKYIRHILVYLLRANTKLTWQGIADLTFKSAFSTSAVKAGLIVSESIDCRKGMYKKDVFNIQQIIDKSL